MNSRVLEFTVNALMGQWGWIYLENQFEFWWGCVVQGVVPRGPLKEEGPAQKSGETCIVSRQIRGGRGVFQATTASEDA